MVDIIEQFSGPKTDTFTLELDAGTRQLAKGRARAWARKQYPTKRPRNITVGSISGGETTQSKVTDFIPDSFARNIYEVQVTVEK